MIIETASSPPHETPRDEPMACVVHCSAGAERSRALRTLSDAIGYGQIDDDRLGTGGIYSVQAQVFIDHRSFFLPQMERILPLE